MKHILLRFLALSSVAFLAIAPHTTRATDLSITTASFLPGANADKIIGKAGAAITIGQLLYYDSGTESYKLADANASGATALVVGMAGSAAASGQAVIVIKEDADMTIGGAILSMAAPVYVLSATAGGIAPSADIAAGWYPSVVIIATSTTKCVFKAGALRGKAVAVAP